jgi:AcrR family transcriptional regulator
MKGWDYQELKALLDQVAGGADPDDPKERKRLLIVDAAAQLFAKQGYRKTSVDQVARRAGVAKGTVYLYFKTKAELLLHGVIEEKRRALHNLRDLMGPELTARQRLKRWLVAVFVRTAELPLITRLLTGDREILSVLYQYGADRGEDWQGMQHQFLLAMIDEAAAPHRMTPLETADRAKVLFGFVMFAGMVQDEQVRGGLSLERFAQLLAEMIVDGIAPPPGGRAPARDREEGE